MTKTTKFALSLLAALSLITGAQAVPITGTIGFTGGVTMDSGSVNTATKVINWYGTGGTGNPTVNSATGSFAPLIGSSASIAAPWFFNTASLVNNFWTVGSFTFSLTSSHIVSQAGGFVNVSGVGFFNAPNFDQTAGNWSFSAQDPSTGQVGGNALFTFSTSQSAAVPEAGTTAILLGCALTGLALFAKYRKQSVA